MCNVSKGFKFCTCSDLSAAEYTWRLTRYLGNDENGPVGSIIGPSHDLGKGLTAAGVLALLNAGKAFDFEYVPVENDCLQINHRTKDGFRGYMSFLYSGGEWAEGMNRPLSSITEEIAKGEVEI